jgi:hypothetical protein
MDNIETNQLHAGDTAVTDQAQESQTSQPSETAEIEQPGADTKSTETPKETTPKPEAKVEPKKTYTAEEVAQIQQKKDAEIAEHQRRLAELTLRQQIGEMQRQEQLAQVNDQKEVESGAITQQEAVGRKELRAKSVQLNQMIQQLTPQAEILGRIACANEMAKEYGISAEDLIADKTLASPQMMERKAAKMALAARDAELRKVKVKPETFDRGPSGEVPGDSESLSIDQIEKMPIEQLARHKSIKKYYD